MMNLIRLAAAAIVIALSGCLYSPHIMGEKPAQIDPKDWNGTWVDQDGKALIVEVIDPERAVLRVSGLKGMDFEYDVAVAYLRVSGNWMFLSMQAGGDDSSPGFYLWWRIERYKETVLSWLPDLSKFKSLVSRNVLPGVSEKDVVFLGELTPEHSAIISSEKHGVFFHWDNPGVFRRIAR